ncbi:MAG: FtsX-like permease family protein, partial [Candidatus Aminicenantes bacterium]|nr:FtsX-like permease family protein [Candidatus Aminicenantes bacterium]
FAFLGLFIACLGLFGLASLLAERRRKEIGIRRVLGASTAGIAWTMSGEFVRWILLANALAVPAVVLVMNRWLSQFAERITLGPWIFAATALLTLSLAVSTVGFRAFRVARANPVEPLRSE